MEEEVGEAEDVREVLFLDAEEALLDGALVHLELRLLPQVREFAQMEIDQTLKTDTAMDWTVEKLGYLPKFPTEDKGAMEREAMEILTAFRVEIQEDCCPTMKEAMADPQEHLLSMAGVLCMGMDPLEGERD